MPRLIATMLLGQHLCGIQENMDGGAQPAWSKLRRGDPKLETMPPPPTGIRRQHVRARRVELGEVARVVAWNRDSEGILRFEQRPGEVRVPRGVHRQAGIVSGSGLALDVIEARRVDQLRACRVNFGDVLQAAGKTDLAQI